MKFLLQWALSLLLLVSPFASAQSESESRYEWDLTDIYESAQEWEQAMQALTERVKQFATLQGTLGESATALATVLNEYSDLSKEVVRAFVYTNLSWDADQRQPAEQERFGRARQMYANFEEYSAWLDPEILAIGENRLQQFMQEEPQLGKFKFNLQDILRRAPHTLDARTEAILAQAGLVLSAPSQIYQNYANADIPWPTITLSEGNEVTLNQSGYGQWRAAANRDDRKLVFDTFWATWQQYRNGMGATLAAEVQSNVFSARVRNFGGTLESNLFDDGLPPEVYSELVEQVNNSLPMFHRYLKLRGRILEVNDLRYYDIYPPLVPGSTEKFDIARSKELTLKALEPFGKEYLALLRQGFSQQWMHSHPQPGKRSGAYVQGSVYDEHPYVLLNHTDDYESLSTFAHEWGHAVHSLLANKNNSWENAGYSTFIAEMASTINEILLQEYMIANARSNEEKLLYLGGALEQIRGTFFRQTMFAEFELAIHEAAERGESLSGARFNEIYAGLLKRYHGHDEGVLTIDEEYAVEWAFIPHFYRDFYVFQYATSITGAAWFAEQFLSGNDEVRDAFLRVLSAGGSDYPHNILLNEAGLDMTQAEAYGPVLRRMTSLMDRIEALL